MIGAECSSGKVNKETESSQILNKFDDLIKGFENTINDLEGKLVTISMPKPSEENVKDPCIAQARPPLFFELHELANRLSKQLSIFRDVSSRINL